MGILSWIVVGLIGGWLAGLAMKTRFGVIGNIVVGIIGGLIGGWLAGQLFNVDPMGGISLPSILVSFAGAVLLIAVVRMINRRR